MFNMLHSAEMQSPRDTRLERKLHRNVERTPCISGPRLRLPGSRSEKGKKRRRRGCRRTKRGEGEVEESVRGLPSTYKLYALNEIYGWRFERDHCPSSLTSLPLYSSTWSSLSPRESPILLRLLRESLRSQRTARQGRRDAAFGREHTRTRGRWSGIRREKTEECRSTKGNPVPIG